MTDQSKKTKTIQDLDKLYFESDSCDSEVFAEMRSNLLLIAGEHYNKAQSAFFRRVRDSKQINEQQKMRLTKNHVQKITKIYANTILSAAPGVSFTAKDESDLQDQKSAELHHSVWQDAIERYNLDEKIDDWCDDFIGIGEVAVKIFWDQTLGPIASYQQATDEDGTPLYEDQAGEQHPYPFHPETNQPLSPSQGEPNYQGQFVFETIHGFNLLRSAEAKTMHESPYFIIRKMMTKDELVSKFPDQEGKINVSADQTMVVFDPTKGGYHKAMNQVMVKEYFFKPCSEYPEGYFYITTKDVKLTEGELPGGVFPVLVKPFEKIQTTPRGRSAVKQMRPYQSEINRAASKIAEHQVTLGDDKIILKNGSKVSAGVAMPGVRAINITGQDPTILAGRDGSQYLSYMVSQIDELYNVMMVAEFQQDSTENGQIDPYSMLFKAASRKKNFQRYIKRFERFLVDLAKLYVKLARIHLPDDMLIYAVGKKERVNISEFKNSTDICYQIKVQPQCEDIETKFGTQVVLNHLVQYSGANLSREDLGKLIRLMPYANMEQGFEDLTMDFDSSTNDILALDRGEMPMVSQYDNHTYCVKRATSRMRKPDFKFLSPQIQQNYSYYVQGHEMAETQRIQQVQQAEAGFIPTDGYLVVCDLYVPDPTDPEKTKRARVPYASLKWLIDKLESQGQSLQELETMNQGNLAEMASMLTSRGKQSPQQMPQQRQQPQMMANGMAPNGNQGQGQAPRR